MADLAKFRSQILAKGGLAKANRSVVVITPPPKLSSFPTERLTYLCENGEVPGRSVNTSDIRYYGPGFKSPNQTIYNDITLTFLLSEDMSEKNFFDAWLEIVNGKTYGYDMAFRNEYATSIHIASYHEGQNIMNDDPILKNTLVDAYPVNISPMPTNWAEEGFHRLAVQFVYTEYKSTFK